MGPLKPHVAEVVFTGHSVSSLLQQQTHNQPEPGDGDPRGTACSAGAAHPTRGDESGLWSLWKHFPGMCPVTMATVLTDHRERRRCADAVSQTSASLAVFVDGTVCQGQSLWYFATFFKRLQNTCWALHMFFLAWLIKNLNFTAVLLQPWGDKSHQNKTHLPAPCFFFLSILSILFTHGWVCPLNVLHTVACGVCRAVRTPGHPSQCLTCPATALPRHGNRLRRPLVVIARINSSLTCSRLTRRLIHTGANKTLLTSGFQKREYNLKGVELT